MTAEKLKKRTTRLTMEQRKEIFDLVVGQKIPIAKIAAQFGCSVPTVYNIKKEFGAPSLQESTNIGEQGLTQVQSILRSQIEQDERRLAELEQFIAEADSLRAALAKKKATLAAAEGNLSDDHHRGATASAGTRSHVENEK